jgi:hypothetical protein
MGTASNGCTVSQLINAVKALFVESMGSAAVLRAVS